MSDLRLTDYQLSFMNGWFLAFEDFQDGAWLAACEESCEALCKTEESFRGLDPDDVWDAWMDAMSEEARGAS